MPVTVEHEAPLEVLERFPGLLPQLLREQFGRAVPADAQMRPVPANFNLTIAPEFRSDGASLLITGDDTPACAVIVESQRAIDADKLYSWPYYLGALHSKYRCPTYLIVIAIGEDADAVAAWARQPIASFQPGSGFAPLVIGPPELPPASTVEEAMADLPRAVLGAMMHVGDPDGPEVAYRTMRAAYEAHGLGMLTWMYNLVRGIVGDERFTKIERLVMLDVQRHYFPRTAFEREHFHKGEAKAILGVLAARNISVDEEQRARLLACQDSAKLDLMIDRVATVSSVGELLADL